MDCNINGVTCIKGEIHSIMTLMRLHTRWSLTKVTRDVSYQEDDALVQSFRRLNEYLEGFFDLREVDCVMYIMPFHNIIVSEKASGPLTSSALTSLSKFALYGFLSEQCPRVQEGISLISSCISRCVFEETDWESDELILMKLLELSALCYRCNASRLLTISSAWEIYNTCVSIHNHYRASKILKSEAENALVHLTLSTFGRIVHSPTIRNQRAVSKSNDVIRELDSMKGRNWESIKDNYNLSSDVGVTLLLLKIMSTLSDMADSQKQPVETVKFSLMLINIALETGGPALGAVQPLVDILSNEVCRNLLRASQSDDLAIISLSLRVVYNLFMSIKNHMKVQLEVFLISVHLRLINSSSVAVPAGVPANPTPSPLAAKEELALESLLEFCREPSLMNDIYVNYDCDVQCTNLFDTIINTLCSRALPTSLHAGTSFGKAKASKAAPASSAVPGSSAKAKSRAVEAASPSSQLLDFGSSGSLFGLDNPAPTSQAVPTQGLPSPVRLSIVNRLALDGVLAVLRSVAGRCVSSASVAQQSNGRDRKESSASRNDISTGGFLSIDPNDTRSASAAAADDVAGGTGEGAGVEQLVDKWCESGSTSPTADMLSQEDLEGSHSHTAAAAASQQWPYARHRMGSDLASSAGGSPYSAAHGESLQGLSAVDGENEETAAVIQARARQAEMLRQRKLMKHKYKLAAEKFNNKPLKADWIRFSMDLGILEPSPSLSTGTQPGHPAATPAATPAAAAGVEKESSATKNALHGQEQVASAPAAAEPVAAKPPALAAEPTTGIDAAALARFFRRTPGLGKTQIGEYISKGPPDMYPFHALVLKEYVKTFDFSGENSSFDAALRMFLGEFKLPGEAQCIDRIMEAFAGHLYEHLGPGRPFANADAAYILAFSTIMLNTDLHNPQIPQSKKMTKAEFVRNNRGINDGKDIPQDYLEKLYNEIKNRQIQVDIDITDTTTALGLMDFADNTMWNKLLHKGTADQEPAIFTSTLDARRNSLPLGTSSAFEAFPSSSSSKAGAHLSLKQAGPGGGSGSGDAFPLPPVCSRAQSGASAATAQRALYERDMFLVMARPVLETLVLLYDNATEDQLVCRILRGLWDFISICADFGLHQMLNSVVHLLCFRSRALLEGERRVPLKPHTRNNVLAHKAHFKQLQADTGLDLHALVSLDFDTLITYQSGPMTDRHEHAKFLNTAEHAPLQLQTNKPEVSWSYSWMVKGELLMRVAFHTAERTPFALQEDAWSAILMLLSWVRARGALPPALALVGDDFRLNEVHWQDPLPIADSEAQAALVVLPPSVYAHRCYLEAYGLALERSGARNKADSGAVPLNQQPHDPHNNAGAGGQGGGAWFGLGFLFSGPQAEGGARPYHGALTAPSGTLDLPNLYRNTNASGCVSMTGEPLRPDDEILTLSVERCKPAELIYQVSLGDAEVTSTVFRSILSMLAAMVKQLTVSSRSAPALSVTIPTPAMRSVSGSSSVSSSAAADAVDLESSFPVQMLSSQFVPSEAKELDAVALLEWITHIVLRDDDTIRLFWPEINDFLKTVLEENVELVAARCPYFLERCISVLTRGVLCVVTTPSSQQDGTKLGNESLSAGPTAKSAPLTKSLLHSAALASSSRQAAWSAVWQSLRLLRGVPSEVIANLSDRLGTAVLELLRKCHAQPHLMTSERWFMMFSLLSAASSGSAGRPFVWDAVRYLVDHDLIDDANFTACRHLVLRFVLGVFPGDSSEEQRNKASGAASAHKRPPANRAHDRRGSGSSEEDAGQVVGSIDYLMRLCLMAVAGFRSKFVKSGALHTSDLAAAAGAATDRQLRSSLVLQSIPTDTSQVRSERATREVISFIIAVEAPMQGKGTSRKTSLDRKSDLPGMGSPAASYLLSPAGGANGAAASSFDGRDLQSISVPCIYFPRAEEVELLWLETCKIYADLSRSPNAIVSSRATQSLQTVVRAGMANTFSDSLVLKALGELVARMPLGFSATVSRTANADTPGQDASSIAHNIAHAVSVSQRSCNVVFEIVVAQIKVARDTDEFQVLWTRFVSLVASNAQAAVPKGQHWWHDEMCDMLEALLRLLRLPVPPPASATQAMPKSSPRLAEAEGKAKPAEIKQMALPVQQQASWGILGWIVAPLVAATDGPDVVKSSPTPSEPTSAAEKSLSPDVSPAIRDIEIEPSDGFLLRTSWQQICSAFPAFPASLQARDPKLLSRITAALSLPERYFRKNSRATAVAGGQTHTEPSTAPLMAEGSPEAELKPSRMTVHAHVPVDAVPVDAVLVDAAPEQATSELFVAPVSTEEIASIVINAQAPVPADARSMGPEPDLQVSAVPTVGRKEQDTPQKAPQEVPVPPTAASATTNGSEMDTITLTSIDRSGMSLASHTPLRSALHHHHQQQLLQEALGTPLADESMSVIMPTPVETPHGDQGIRATGGLSPFVRDLTPIFASAEGERRAVAHHEEPSADKTGVVRRLEVGSPAAGPWKTYPVQSPLTPTTPLIPHTPATVHQVPLVPQPLQAQQVPQAPQVPQIPHASIPKAAKATPLKASTKPMNSRVQIV